MNDAYDEIPLPSEGVLSDEETARQLREDSCRQYVEHIRRLERAIHAAHGLLSPLGNQVTPSLMAIREAIQILRPFAADKATAPSTDSTPGIGP